jgi:uncharacterized membrane protein
VAQAPARRTDAALGAYLAALATVAALALWAADIWAAQVVSAGLLLTVPGVLLLRALRVSAYSVGSFPVYVPAASLVFLLAAGLGASLLGPVVGVEQPLRTEPLLVAVGVPWLVLLALGARAPEEARIRWDGVLPQARNLWPLLLPLGAAAGAARLSSSGDAALATIVVTASGAALLGALMAAKRLSHVQLMLVLYGVSLALMWSFSLPGPSVYGFDIQTELNVVRETIGTGVWETAHPDDAYGAMLSLTVLPATLHSLTGLSELALLKALYPALFALFPVALFGLANRFMRRRYAYFAAAFVVVHSFFFQQLPAIARQEIGLLLLVVLFAALLERRLGRRAGAWAFVALLGLGVAVTHYSTDYLAVGMLAGGLALGLVISLVRRSPVVPAALVVALVALAAGGAVWNGPVTKSGSNVSRFADDLSENGLNLLPNARPGDDLLQTYLSGNAPRRVDARSFQRLAVDEYREQYPFIRPLRSARESRYDLRTAAVPQRDELPRVDDAIRAAEIPFNQLFIVFAFAGSLILALRRKTSRGLRLLALIGVSTLGVLALARLSGTAANAYNQERAFVQMMIPLSIAIAWAAGALRSRYAGRWTSTALAVLAVGALAAIFVNSSGLRGSITGGDRPANLSTRGEDHERFSPAATELESGRWLGGYASRREIAYADRYGALRLLSAAGRYDSLFQAVTPRTLNHRSWVYQSQANTRGRARGDLRGRYSLYAWPRRFLAENWSVVYDNGPSRVLYR